MKKFTLIIYLLSGFAFIANAQHLDYSKLRTKDTGNNLLFQSRTLSENKKEVDKWRKNKPERCSLIRNKVDTSNIKATSDKYDIINQEEKLQVERKNGRLKITYKTELEILKYKEKKNGQYKYKYQMRNGKEYIKLKKSYNGKMKFSENAPIDPEKAQKKLNNKIKEAARSCRIN